MANTDRPAPSIPESSEPDSKPVVIAIDKPSTYSKLIRKSYLLPVKRILIVLLILIVLAGIINGAIVIYIESYMPDKEHIILRDKWQRIYNLDSPLDYLVIGDSSGNQGFDPAIVEQKLGLRGLNLATIGTFGFVDDVWFLETYLELYGVPDLVISLHAYDVPTRDVDIDQALSTYPVPFSVVNAQINPVHVADFNRLIQIYQKRLFPLLYRFDEVRNILEKAIAGNFNGIIHSPQFNEYGLMTLGEYDEFVVEDDMFVFRRDYDAGFIDGHFSQSNLDALHQLVQLADQHDFDIYFLNSPIYDDLYEHSYTFDEIRKDLSKTYESVTAQSSNAHYFSADFPFRADYMENLDHVLDRGVADYTTQVMNLVWAD